MSDIRARREVGLGVGLKFAIPVTVAVALAVLIFGLVIRAHTETSLGAQFDRVGDFAARAVASPDLDSWNGPYNTYEDLAARIAAIQAELRLPEEWAAPARPSGGEAAAGDAGARIRAHEERQRAANERRLRNLLGGGVIDVLILEPRGDGGLGIRRSASGRDRLATAEEGPWRPAGEGETLVRRSRVLENDRPVPCRSFRHPIRHPQDPARIVGHAEVIFSEDAIDTALSEATGRIVLFTILAALACAVTAFACAGRVTRPIRRLIRDVEAVGKGDLSHRTVVTSHDEIGLLARTFDQMTRNLERAEEMRRDLLSTEHQVQIVRDIQARLFPAVLPSVPGATVDAGTRVSEEISSDLLDIIPVTGDRIGLLVMNASGRGLPAAIVLSTARALFRAVASDLPSPAAALRRINALLTPDLKRGLYVTAAYAVFDGREGRAVLASAGHKLPAVHHVRERDGLLRVHPEGMAMGLDRGPVFDRTLTETEIALAPGDTLLLGTAGILELATPEGPLGEKRFLGLVLRTLREGGAEPARELIRRIEASLAPDPGPHDAILVTLTRP